MADATIQLALKESPTGEACLECHVPATYVAVHMARKAEPSPRHPVCEVHAKLIQKAVELAMEGGKSIVCEICKNDPYPPFFFMVVPL